MLKFVAWPDTVAEAVPPAPDVGVTPMVAEQQPAAGGRGVGRERHADDAARAGGERHPGRAGVGGGATRVDVELSRVGAGQSGCPQRAGGRLAGVRHGEVPDTRLAHTDGPGSCGWPASSPASPPSGPFRSARPTPVPPVADPTSSDPDFAPAELGAKATVTVHSSAPPAALLFAASVPAHVLPALLKWAGTVTPVSSSGAVPTLRTVNICGGARRAHGGRREVVARRVIESSVPVPLSVDATDPPGVADTCSVADLAPCEVGANRTVTVQVAPPASVWLLQVSAGIEYCDASVPLSAVLSAPDVACPVFVIVKTCSALLPDATVPN